MVKRESSSATILKRSIGRMGQHSPGKLQNRIIWPTGSNVCAVVRLRMLRSKSATGRRSQCTWPTSRTGTSSALLWKWQSRSLQNSDVRACCMHRSRCVVGSFARKQLRKIQMAGQSIERREILRILAMAAGVATFPGFSKWTFACSHIGNPLAQIKPAVYRPVFFSAPEYALVERLTDLIIPSDDTPGAHDAGVSEFVDLMVSRDPELQRDFRAGLSWLNMRSHETWGKAFVMLNPDQQAALLESLAYRKKF